MTTVLIPFRRRAAGPSPGRPSAGFLPDLQVPECGGRPPGSAPLAAGYLMPSCRSIRLITSSAWSCVPFRTMVGVDWTPALSKAAEESIAHLS